MSTPALEKTRATPVLVGGLLAGTLAVLLLGLPAKWTLSVVVGMAAVAAAVFQSDLRRYLQVLLVLSIPLATFNTQLFARRDYFGTPGIALGLVEVVLAALYLAWLFGPGPSRERVRAVLSSKANIGAVALVMLAALSILVARDRALAAFGFVALLKAYLLFFYVACNVERKNLRWLTGGLLFAVFAQETLALAQYLTHSSLGLASLGESRLMQMTFGGESYVRVAATLVHPNQFANFVGLVLPLALALMLLDRRGPLKQALYGGVYVLGVVVLVLTFSRTGWIHLITSTLVVVVLALRHGKVRREAADIALVGGLVALAAVIALSEAILSRLFASNPILVTARIDMARVAMRMIGTHPILGIGANNYVSELPHYDFIPVMQAPVHNLYLLVLAEMGILGLAALLALIVFLFVRLGSAFRSNDHLVAAIAIGMTGGLMGFLVDGISDFSYILPSTNLLFWLLAGLAIALTTMREEGADADPVPLSVPDRS